MRNIFALKWFGKLFERANTFVLQFPSANTHTRSFSRLPNNFTPNNKCCFRHTVEYLIQFNWTANIRYHDIRSEIAQSVSIFNPLIKRRNTFDRRGFILAIINFQTLGGPACLTWAPHTGARAYCFLVQSFGITQYEPARAPNPPAMCARRARLKVKVFPPAITEDKPVTEHAVWRCAYGNFETKPPPLIPTQAHTHSVLARGVCVMGMPVVPNTAGVSCASILWLY